MTARPASAARTANTHHPTAWGWIDVVTAVAMLSWFWEKNTCMPLTAAANRGTIGCPMAQSHEVFGSSGRPLLHGAGKRLVVYKS